MQDINNKAKTDIGEIGHRCNFVLLLYMQNRFTCFQVPRLIQRHTNEVRTLKEQIRKYKERSMKLDENLKDKDSQLAQTKRNLQKYKKIVESKNLGERDQLANKLTAAESALDESRQRVQVIQICF